MTKNIDWKDCERRLVKDCLSTIRRFASEHREEVVFFALFSDYCYGEVAISFDTAINSATQVAEQIERVNKSRTLMFDRDKGWRDARYYISRASDRITDYAPSTTMFAHPEYGKIEFPEWKAYFRSDDFSEEYGLEDRVIVLFWRVLDSLVRQRAFELLSGEGALWVGFEFHDSPLGLIVTHRIARAP
jgi:hypothetical protein